mgnify:CR=1 FL=1
MIDSQLLNKLPDDEKIIFSEFYINNLKDYVKINHNSYDIYDCLELVLPNESMKLHPYKDKKTKDSNNYTIKTLFKRYLWECE